MWRALLGFILIVGLQSAHAADALRVVYFSDYEPISWVSKGAIQGVLIDIVDEALGRRMGLEVDHSAYPWARAQAMVKHGHADVFLTVATAERREYTTPSEEAVLSLDNVVFIAAGGTRRNELEQVKAMNDLRPFLLGNYLGNSWAKTHFADYKVHWVPQLSTALQMLRAQRVDVFVEAAQVVRHHVHKLHMENDIIELAPTFETVQFHLCVRKNSPFASRLAEFDGVIRSMRKDGSLDSIYKKYHIGKS